MNGGEENLPAGERMGAIADAFERRLEGVSERIVARLRDELAEFRDLEAPELWVQAREFAEATRGAAAEAVRRRRVPAEFPADLPAVRIGFEGGATLQTVLQAYRVGQSTAFSAWVDAVEEVVPEADRAQVLRELGAFLFAYEHRLVEWVGAEWESLARGGGRSGQRLRLIRSLLEGDAETAPGLDYDLGATHVGVIAWGPQAQQELARLGASLGSPALVARAGEGIVWGWFGRSQWTAKEAEIEAADPGGQACFAFGGPAQGVEGFRRTHDEAGDAYVVGRRLDLRVVRYREVVIEALAMQDESASRRLMLRVLGELAAEGARCEKLRETLLAYYRRGQNAAATAQGLGVHEQTIARRLARAADLLGAHPGEDRAEIETALRIRELLGPGPRQG